ncbi:tetratricopeptide repeat protein [Kitasatospora sp. MAP5-34]|uniref:tetratricopeptide repeat protein n=1 Tax=Kitasatospora sp. MAP5-34 TaxID=3035102 RepID=UPI0024736B26|nr:tetratricopeptide repeat protein [Kitasatospora sp. MAP5-34]MDH6575385.1 tetratricopeptide (TPR) repeat protein [Kitasatospora sp. MAP5-34]
MSYTETELRRLHGQALGLPNGPAQFAALEEVIRHADALELTEFAFEVRMNATDAFQLGGVPSKSFVTFAWCLAVYDREPARFGGHHEHQLLWQYKWMVSSLAAFPEIPLARTLTLLDDMEQRFKRGGHSMHAVLQHRGDVAHALGDLTEAQRWYEEMSRTRQDDLSDCSGCVPGSLVRVLTALGRYEEAIRVGEPARSGGGCVQQPHAINSELLVPYLRAGRGADAAEAHRVAYRAIREKAEHLEEIAQNLMFCVHSGNPERGLDLVERHLPLLDRAPAPLDELEFAAAAAAVLAQFEARGEGGRDLRFPTVAGRRLPDRSVTELADELRARAHALAARFDDRNGNDHQSRRLAEQLAAGPIGEPVPLSVFERRLPPAEQGAIRQLVERVAQQTAAGQPAEAARTQALVAAAYRDAGQLPEALNAAEQAVRALDRAGLPEDTAACRYLLAQLYLEYHRTDHARAALQELLDRAGPAPGVPSAPELHTEIALTYGHHPSAAAAEHHLAAARGFGAAGRTHAQLESFRYAIEGMAAFDVPAALGALAEADTAIESLTEAEAPGVATKIAELQIAAAELLREDQRLPDSRERLLAARPALERYGDAEDLGELLTALSTTELELGDPAAAETAALAAIALLDDPVDEAWYEAIALIRALRALGRDAEAAEAMELYSIDEDDLLP